MDAVHDRRRQEKRDIMAKIHKKRSETGYPYIFFTDNVNKQAPEHYKRQGHEDQALSVVR